MIEKFKVLFHSNKVNLDKEKLIFGLIEKKNKQKRIQKNRLESILWLIQ